MLKTVSSITNAIGALNYKGTWNASTNTPALASGVGTKGDYYVVSVAGTTALDGISNWGVGDWATFNGSVWQRVEGGATLNGTTLDVSGVSTLTGGVTTSGATDLGLGTNGSVTGALLDTANNLIIGRSTKLNPGDANSVQVMSNGPQYVIMNTTAGAGQSYNLSMSQFGTMFFQNASGAGVYMTYGATSWTSTSDLRKKNVTGKIEDALAKVNSLTPARFTWKSDETNTPQVGLIAQEVQAVLPEVVTDDGEGTLGVRYAETVPLLVAAIQELTTRLAILEGK